MSDDLRERVAAAMWNSRGNGDWNDATNTALIAIYRNLADAALAEMGGVRVKPLEWEDYPSDDGPIMSKAVTLHGTYFIVDDTDDFSGLYLQVVSHDDARWWQHVRSTCETIVENVHDDDLEPLKATANEHHRARILAALEPAPSVREAARVLLDALNEESELDDVIQTSMQEESDADGTDEWVFVLRAGLRAIAEGKDDE